MKKFFKYLVFALIALVFIGTFVFLYIKSKPEEVRYEVLEVTTGDICRKTIVTGKIEPRNEVNIKPQINGIISELLKEPGQLVQEGEVIAKLKVIPDMQALSSAESRVRLASLNLDQAKINLDRQKSLFDKQLVSADEYEKVLQAYNQAKEEYIGSKDNLEVIRDGVSSSNAGGSSTLVRSTISGLILDIPVKVGNSVIQANTMNDGTTVATVANMSDLIFDGNIDETEVGKLQEGMPMEIRIGALPDYRNGATLEYISPKAVENNGTNQFEIKAAISENSSVTIRSGYSANAEIILDQVSSVLYLPESALEFEEDKTFVYLEKGEDQWERIEVEVGLSDGVNIEIVSGLKSGDKVRGNKIINS